MTRRNLIASLLSLPAGAAQAASGLLGTLHKPASHWQPHVSEAAYKVLFEEDTERPHSSPLLHEKREGTFVCAACHNPLFDSSTKYESGTGWPSFWKPLDGALGTKTDYKIIFPRTEYHCARCGGHQGHVFDDGPRPTGQRYCNNGLALKFVPKGEPLPQLRE
jgi:peptide-methionine (R)-S-oxide reductase